MDWFRSMVPRACFFIDSTFRSTLESFELIFYSSETIEHRHLAEEDLQRLWQANGEYRQILPCLSVRSGLDLFLSVKSYPPGSEIILTAINIPTVIHIIHHHNLKIRSCDIDFDTLAPSVTHFQSLINERTVAVFIAHIYGKRNNIESVIKVCKTRSISILEDCAEAFSGFNYLGHSDSDIVLFSFGTIKFATAYGGGIARVKNKQLFDQMKNLQETYPVQNRSRYAMKLAKYALFSIGFNNAFTFKWGTGAFRLFGVDHKEIFVPLMRGFPRDLITSIRHKPSVLLLNNLTFRLLSFDINEHKVVYEKGDYITKLLPSEVQPVGTNASDNGYWLYPVLVDEPEIFIAKLNELGVDASRGSTQLGLVYDDLNANSKTSCSTPCAKFLMDHVLYLPVHKLVTYDELDRIVVALKKVCQINGTKRLLLPPSS